MVAAAVVGGGEVLGGDIVGGLALGDVMGGATAEVVGGATADAVGGAVFDGVAGGGMGGMAGAAGDFGAGTYAGGLGAEATGAAGTLGESMSGFSPMNGAGGMGGAASDFGMGSYDALGQGGAFGMGNAASSLGNPASWTKSLSDLVNSQQGRMLGQGAKALGTMGSGMMNGNAAQKAAQIQADAGTQSIAMQQRMFDTSQANLQPFMQGGASALSSLSGKFADGSLGGNFTPQDFLNNKDPGYAFQLNQGNQALQNSQAARDGVLSGPAMKGLIDYNQGMASTGYQNAYNRWLSSQNNTYDQLSGVAGIGANAAATQANNSQKFAGSIGGTMEGRGNVLGSGVVGQANNYSKAMDGVGSQMYALSDMMSRPAAQPTNPGGYNNANGGFGSGMQSDGSMGLAGNYPQNDSLMNAFNLPTDQQSF